MSVHADCTHPKTKAARAACRAGRTTTTDAPASKPSAAERLRHKAAEAADKVSPPKAESGDVPGRNAAGQVYGGNVSGSCGLGAHDRCLGGGKQWYCTCDCHK